MKNIKKSSGYSVVVVLLIIWFLLVLTTGIFNLILNEMKSNRAMGNYIKAYAWAESAQELALLQIKKYWYAYYDKIEHNINNRSIVLWSDSLNISTFNPNKDTFISYDIWSKVSEYSWTLKSLEYDIIPLFIINNNWEQKVGNIDLSIIFWNNSNLAWNIIWKNNWISWIWNSVLWLKKSITTNWSKFTKQNMNSFINSSDTNYLVLFNSWNSWVIKYKLKSINSWEYFTKPKTSIISSAEIWKYKQNLSTDLDNTEFLNMLKYSIYSN